MLFYCVLCLGLSLRYDVARWCVSFSLVAFIAFAIAFICLVCYTGCDSVSHVLFQYVVFARASLACVYRVCWRVLAQCLLSELCLCFSLSLALCLSLCVL